MKGDQKWFEWVLVDQLRASEDINQRYLDEKTATCAFKQFSLPNHHSLHVLLL